MTLLFSPSWKLITKSIWCVKVPKRGFYVVDGVVYVGVAGKKLIIYYSMLLMFCGVKF